MAQDNKQKKSLLYRLSWNNNGKQLNNDISDILALGQKCIDSWNENADNDMEARKLLQHFQTVERSILNMQECIMNVLRPSTLTHKIFEDNIEFKNKPSDCKCDTKIFKLQEQIGTEKEKYQLLLRDIAILTKEKGDLTRMNDGWEAIFRNKEEALKIHNKLLTENLTKQLANVEKELDELRFQIRTQTTSLKHGLGEVHIKNYELRQRLLQIPILEQNFDQQRQKFILELRACKILINNLKQTLNEEKQNLSTVIEENRNLKMKLPKKSVSKLNEAEYQKSINILEEAVAYFVRQNTELRKEKCDLQLKLNANRCKKVSFKEECTNDNEQMQLIMELEEPLAKNYYKRFENEEQQSHVSKKPTNNIQATTNYNNGEDVDKNNLNTKDRTIVESKGIHEKGSILAKENSENSATDNVGRKRTNVLFLNHKKNVIGDKEEAD